VSSTTFLVGSTNQSVLRKSINIVSPFDHTTDLSRSIYITTPNYYRSYNHQTISTRIISISSTINIKMARTGYAKGANSGHVTTQRPKKVKPSHRKGVSSVSYDDPNVFCSLYLSITVVLVEPITHL
jgi:hypothetical protein